MADAREQYIASRAPRKKRTHPARSAQALNTSGAGIVHRNMMDLQRHPNLSGADVDRLKGLRRDWNRNRKYTDAGMAIAGASTPQEAQKYYRDTTENFRQGNKGAYNKMYPLTGGFMDVAEKGGILGTILSQIGKMGKDGGIPTAVKDTIDAQDEYVAKTFGPNMYDVAGPWFGTASLEDVEISDAPDEPLRVQGTDYVDDIIETDTMPGSPFFPGNLLSLFEKDKVIPGYDTTYIDMVEPDESGLEVDVSLPAQESLPFNDSLREAGIAALHGQGPKWGGTNRRYEDEYTDYVERSGNMPGGPMTYEEFSEAWEGIHQGRPHAGLR